ncbi:MAG: cell division protein FtsH, partial [Clostridia bacterium]|nr:cell division protein FtsH [Clostridia bacterium]
SREYSEETAALIDQEVRAILNNAYKQALQILTDRMPQLKGLAELLIEKETVTREDFLAFMNSVSAAEPVVTEGSVE